MKAPWFHVGVDFIGPLCPISKEGNRYILTLSDYFSKFVEAVPLPDKCAKSVSRILFKVIYTAIQGFDSGPVTARNITRKSVLPNFARNVVSKS